MFKKIGLLFISFLMLATPVFAATEKDKTVVQVNGTYQKEAAPDLVRIYGSINTLNANLEQAKAENFQKITNVVAFLKEQGVNEEQIKTEMYQIEPVYSYDKEKLPALKGYRIINRLEISAPVNSLGDLIQGMTQTGANEINSIRFELKDETNVKEQALEAAIKDALKKADVIASALNKRVFAIKMINESGVYYQPFMMENRALKSANMDTAAHIPQGNISVTANIQMTVELSD